MPRSRPTMIALAASLLAASALAPAPPSSAATTADAAPRLVDARAAAGPTCEGRRATIVGRPGPGMLRGTGGRDVIVTNGQASVRAGGGRDLICVTSAQGRRTTFVDGGAGNDRILVGSRGNLAIEPGPGNDVVRGGSGSERVTQKGRYLGRDVFRLRGGDDSVRYAFLTPRSRDVVHLGPGNDRVSADARARFPMGGARFDGGPGSDHIDLQANVGTQVGTADIDMTRGTVVTDIGTVRAAGFEGLFFRAGNPLAEITYRGTSGNDYLVSHPYPAAADLLGGDDEFISCCGDPGDAVVDAGAGRDSFEFLLDADSVVGDLAAGTATVVQQGATYSYAIPGFEDALALTLGTVSLTGTDGPNRFAVDGCTVDVDAGGGADVVRPGTSEGHNDPDCAGTTSWTLDGGAGDDVLVGSSGDDVLTGGDGTDTADGGLGIDACTAETRRSCES